MAAAVGFLLTLIVSLSLVVSVPIEGNSIDLEEKSENFTEDAALIDTTPTEDEEEDDQVIDLSRVANELFRNPDNDTGRILELYSPETSKSNPEEMGSYLEGDMLIKKAGRNGLISQSSKWPGGVVPFVIRGSFSAREMQIIERGIKEYHAKTCIRFRPRSSETDYVSFENDPSGCWSSVGRIGGKQEVNLQTPGCFLKGGTFLHEVMHALGFLHEQNRYERDAYVDIVWQNIQSSTKTNFDKATSTTTNAYGVGYDYASVMHYSANAFSTNGRPTIVAKDSSAQSRMGQRDGFSSKDLQKLNAMYCRGSRPSVNSARPPRPSSRPTSRPQHPRPPSGYHPQPQGNYPPPQGHYPPPQGHPPSGHYPPPQGHYPPQGSYPPQRPPPYPHQGQHPPQGPYPSQGQYPPQGNNNPVMNFLGGLISGLFQNEGNLSDSNEPAPIGQPRASEIVPTEKPETEESSTTKIETSI